MFLTACRPKGVLLSNKASLLEIGKISSAILPIKPVSLKVKTGLSDVTKVLPLSAMALYPWPLSRRENVGDSRWF